MKTAPISMFLLEFGIGLAWLLTKSHGAAASTAIQSYRCRITQEAGKNGARILKNDAFNYANKKPRILAFGITYFIKDTAIRNGRADAEGLPNYENPAFAHEEPQTEHHQ